MKTNTQMGSFQDFNKKTLLSALLAAGMAMGSAGVFAGTATGTMTVNATLTSGCTVSASTLEFASATALTSSSDVTGDTGNSLQIACSSGTTPTIWSDTARTLSDGTNTFAFNLSQTSGAAADNLPTTTGAAEGISGFTADGTSKTVTIYGKILASNFGSKPAGSYTKAVTLSVNY
ncbi:MAG: spore coat protein U domain-containing protein [Gammaproteobacteria bacterium]